MRETMPLDLTRQDAAVAAFTTAFNAAVAEIQSIMPDALKQAHAERDAALAERDQALLALDDLTAHLENLTADITAWLEGRGAAAAPAPVDPVPAAPVPVDPVPADPVPVDPAQPTA